MRHDLVALLALLAVAVGALWPASMLPDEAIPGDDHPAWRDGYVFLWNGWWFRQLLTGRETGLHTRLLFAPRGIDLRYHSLSPLPSMLQALLGFPLGAIRAYNLVLILMAWASGVGAWLLGRHLRLDRPGAWTAGALFILAPARTVQTLGHPNLAAAAFLPLGVLVLLRAARHPRIGRLLLAAGALTGAALCSWYHLLPLAVFTAIWALRALGPLPGGRFRRLLGLAVPWMLAALLLAPLAWPLLSRPVPADAAETIRYSAGWRELLLPHSLHPLRRWTGWPPGPKSAAGPLESSVYLGWITLGVALAGARASDRRLHRCALAFALLFVLLATGPGRLGPRPYDLLTLLPGAGVARVPARLVQAAALALALAAGLTASRAWQSRRGRIGLLLLAIPWMLDSLSAPLPMLDARIPGPVRRLAAAPASSLHLDLPPDWTDPRLLFYQTVHGHPLPAGFSARIPPERFELYELGESGLLRPAARRRQEALSPQEVQLLRDLPRVLDAPTVMIHRDRLTGPAWQGLAAAPERWIGGQVIARDERLVLLEMAGMPEEGPLRAYAFPGWYGLERWGHRRVRWSRGGRPAVLTLPGLRAGALLGLRLLPPPGHLRASVRLRWQPGPEAQGEVGPGWTWLELVVPDPVPRHLRLEVPRPARPADSDPASRDHRLLGVALGGIRQE